MKHINKILLTLFITLISFAIFIFLRKPGKKFTPEIKHAFLENRMKYSRKGARNKIIKTNLSEDNLSTDTNLEVFSAKTMLEQSLDLCKDMPEDILEDVKCSDIRRVNKRELEVFIKENQENLSSIKDYIVNSAYDTVSIMGRFISPTRDEDEMYQGFVNKFGPAFNAWVIFHIISERKHNVPLENVDLYIIADQFDEFSAKVKGKAPFLPK